MEWHLVLAHLLYCVQLPGGGFSSLLGYFSTPRPNIGDLPGGIEAVYKLSVVVGMSCPWYARTMKHASKKYRLLRKGREVKGRVMTLKECVDRVGKGLVGRPHRPASFGMTMS